MCGTLRQIKQRAFNAFIMTSNPCLKTWNMIPDTVFLYLEVTKSPGTLV